MMGGKELEEKGKESLGEEITTNHIEKGSLRKLQANPDLSK